MIGCELIRIVPDKQFFGIFEATNEIFTHTKQSSDQLIKQLTNKISNR